MNFLSSSSTINQKLFQIESNFVELNPEKVELFKGQEFNPKNQIKLLVNDKGGKLDGQRGLLLHEMLLKLGKN